MSDYNLLKKRLSGPIYPIPAIFDTSESLDTAAVNKYVRFLQGFGNLPVMTTAGTSRMSVLSTNEVMQLNEAVVSAADKDTLTIVGNSPSGSLSSAIEFGKHAKKIGADILLLYFPDRHYSDEQIVDYYKEISKYTSVGLMAHGMPIRKGQGGKARFYDADLCSKLLDNIPSFVGIKEESLDHTIRNELSAALADDLGIVVAGGSMSMFLESVPYGAQSYLVGVGSICPKIEKIFFEKVSSGDLNAARKIVSSIEEPFFNVAKSIGWHVAMKGAMALAGLCDTYERCPHPEINDQQTASLRAVMEEVEMIK